MATGEIPETRVAGFSAGSKGCCPKDEPRFRKARVGYKMSDGNLWLRKASEAANNTRKDSATWSKATEVVLRQSSVALSAGHVSGALRETASSTISERLWRFLYGCHEKRGRRLSDSAAPNTKSYEEHRELFRLWILGTNQIRSDGAFLRKRNAYHEINREAISPRKARILIASGHNPASSVQLSMLGRAESVFRRYARRRDRTGVKQRDGGDQECEV
ncbi:hypothetical protein B0H16DRAFT_1464097 [Mycena metata]|uniref:Uncharacterized protein n=1 Tax=Mycena metata TaxID=1033252 RepID=A0AAD7N209_9AGAR|nr:hypothetical protein B0H16DRAFT_1464097 [Mycena metata]